MQPAQVARFVDGKLRAIGQGDPLFSSAASPWAGFLMESPNTTEGEETRGQFFFPRPTLVLHTRGTGVVRYRTGTMEHQYVKKPGSIAVLPAQMEFSSFSSTAGNDRLVLELDVFKVQRFLHGDNHAQLMRLTFHDGLYDSRIDSMVRLMKAEIDTECASGAAYAEGLSISLLAYLIGNYSQNMTRASLAHLSKNQLMRIRDYVLANLGKDIRLSELAFLIELSPYQFCRLFKNTVGITPHRYIIFARVEQGKRLLVDKRRSIVEIALLLGFADQSHFTRVFKQIVGSTPSEFRRVAMEAEPDFDEREEVTLRLWEPSSSR